MANISDLRLRREGGKRLVLPALGTTSCLGLLAFLFFTSPYASAIVHVRFVVPMKMLEAIELGTDMETTEMTTVLLLAGKNIEVPRHTTVEATITIYSDELYTYSNIYIC